MNPDLLAAVVSDPAFSFLRNALDSNSASPIISNALGRSVEVTAVRVTRHKPGRRCVLEYDVQSRSHPAATLVGKVRVKGANHRTFDLSQALRKHGFDDNAPDGIHIPQPIAVVPEFRMILHAKAPGIPAGDVLYNSEDIGPARRIAAVAWKLHRTQIPTEKTQTIADELSILRDRFAKLAVTQPELTGRLDQLFAKCERLASQLAPAQPVGIHRDFYPAQVLVDGSRCWLLDLDLYSLGDPALDIGNFLGHMTEHALRVTGSADALLVAENALRDEYLALSEGRVAAESIQIYKYLTLARHIYISTLFPERCHAATQLLDYCEQRL